MEKTHDHEDSKTLKKARTYVEELGLPLPGRPGAEVLEWPENVADLESTELAFHLTSWAGWSGYARFQLAVAETNYAAFSAEHDVTEQVRLFKSKGDYKTVTEHKASVNQAPDMRELRAKMLVAEAEKKMIKALLEGYENKYATISREISRRTADMEESRHRSS
jgi:ribosomal protein L35